MENTLLHDVPFHAIANTMQERGVQYWYDKEALALDFYSWAVHNHPNKRYGDFITELLIAFDNI